MELVWNSGAFRAGLVLLVAVMALSWVSWAIEFDFPRIPERQYEQELGTPYDVRQGSCEPSRLRGEGREADDARELCRRRAADYAAVQHQLVQSFRQTNAAEENLRLSWFQTRFGFFQVLLSTLAVVFTGWAAWAVT